MNFSIHDLIRCQKVNPIVHIENFFLNFILLSLICIYTVCLAEHTCCQLKIFSRLTKCVLVDGELIHLCMFHLWPRWSTWLADM